MQVLLSSTSATADDVHLRARLDYRRLEEAHLKFAVLNVYQRYPSNFLSMAMYSVADTLEEITPIFYKAFEERYAGLFNKYSRCLGIREISLYDIMPLLKCL